MIHISVNEVPRWFISVGKRLLNDSYMCKKKSREKKQLLNDSYQCKRSSSVIHISGKKAPQWFTSVWQKLFYDSLQRKRSSSILNLVWMKLHSDSYECKWSSSIIDACGKNAPVIQLYVWKRETCCYLFGRKYQLMYVANASPWFARLISMRDDI